jgi:NAD(P)H dehydrogenase (quinone)
MVKLAVIFYTTTGTNHRMARVAADAAAEAGAEVRLRKVKETAPPEAIKSRKEWGETIERIKDVDEVSHDDMTWADAYLFSVPTRYGGAASQMRAFIDTLGGLWMEGKLADKCVSAMTSAQTTHGGHETTLQSMYYTTMHWGAIIVPPGYTDDAVSEAGGNPYGTSVVAGENDPLKPEVEAAIAHQARRLVQTTARFISR